MRERWCRSCGKWHEVEAWPIECLPKAPESRSEGLPVPMVISDTMDPTEHIDGRFYTSKSQFRAVTKAHGCIEVGNDPARFKRPPRPKPDKRANVEAIQRADYMVRNGIPVQAAR